jgi:hypothetical protein
MNMGLFGKLLAAPFKIVNAPIRAAENLLNGGERVPEEDRIFSKPLDAIADELEDVDDDE